MSCPIRLYPLRKPKNHRLPVPRYTLTLPRGTTHVHTSYIGIQQHSNDNVGAATKREAYRELEKWITSANGPLTVESFALIDGQEAPGTTIWVGYWTNSAHYTRALASLDLKSIYTSQPPENRAALGLWHETFTTAVSRLETNYSGPDYLPGLGQLRGSSALEHDLATYWGAARDRIPDSGHDLFPRPDHTPPPTIDNTGIREHLTGTNHNNIVHIRSGQWWEPCTQTETDAYEQKLEPTLRKGLAYLNTHAAETGAMGLRYLRNTTASDPLHDHGRKETCGAGFFANLEDLETWAKTHSSHLAIWRGAMAHYKAFPDNRLFRTWHEVSVVKQGEARWEYVNCTAGTGVMGSTVLDKQGL